ncbi:MAG: tyrosine-type recombinase/integrase [Candidatus Dormibacteria bacterium]
MSESNVLARHLDTFFHEHLTAQRCLSPHTVLAYRDAIKLLLQFASRRLRKPVAELHFDDLGMEIILGFLDHLEIERHNSVATRNLRLAALHVFYSHVAARDPISFALCQRVLGIPAKRAPRRDVDYLERDEMEAILDAADRSTPSGRRDYALTTFAWQTGARVGEIITLRACDLQLDPPPHVRIWGKGRKERLVPLWSKTAAVLRAWLDERNVDPRSASPVFVNLHGQPLSRWGVRYILKSLARTATEACPTMAGKNVHPHVLRHTTAVHMLQAGVDPSAIRDVLGHASAETTWRYTRVNLETRRKAVESYAPEVTNGNSPVPIWQRQPDLIDALEAIGRRRDYVER